MSQKELLVKASYARLFLWKGAYIAASFGVDKEDFELDTFNKRGGLGKMWRLFGEETDQIISELNESLVA